MKFLLWDEWKHVRLYLNANLHKFKTFLNLSNLSLLREVNVKQRNIIFVPSWSFLPQKHFFPFFYIGALKKHELQKSIWVCFLLTFQKNIEKNSSRHLLCSFRNWLSETCKFKTCSRKFSHTQKEYKIFRNNKEMCKWSMHLRWDEMHSDVREKKK